MANVRARAMQGNEILGRYDEATERENKARTSLEIINRELGRVDAEAERVDRKRDRLLQRRVEMEALEATATADKGNIYNELVQVGAVMALTNQDVITLKVLTDEGFTGDIYADNRQISTKVSAFAPVQKP